jgi:hypothetical protein
MAQNKQKTPNAERPTPNIELSVCISALGVGCWVFAELFLVVDLSFRPCEKINAALRDRRYTQFSNGPVRVPREPERLLSSQIKRPCAEIDYAVMAMQNLCSQESRHGWRSSQQPTSNQTLEIDHANFLAHDVDRPDR